MNIYLDDVRETPEGFLRCFTVEECISLLQTHAEINILSLDNDLGDGFQEGYKVLDFLEEEIYFGRLRKPKKIIVHSANPVAKQRMLMVIKKLEYGNI